LRSLGELVGWQHKQPCKAAVVLWATYPHTAAERRGGLDRHSPEICDAQRRHFPAGHCDELHCERSLGTQALNGLLECRCFVHRATAAAVIASAHVIVRSRLRAKARRIRRSMTAIAAMVGL